MNILQWQMLYILCGGDEAQRETSLKVAYVKKGGDRMEKQFSMAGGGILRAVIQHEQWVEFYAQREKDDRGLYKVWLGGAGGKRMLLGTLVPEDGKLCLKRRCSLDTLLKAGCWPILVAEAVMAFPFDQRTDWYCEATPQKLVSDPVLRRQLESPMLCCKEEDGFFLATPFRTEKPVALNALFCLAKLEQINGTLCLVWSFDGRGLPRLLHGME